MKRHDLEARIRACLADALRDANEPVLKLQQDPFRGWNVAVISNQFADYSPAERRQILAPALDGIEISWLDLLTFEEVEWAGPLPGGTPSEELPLWPEAMARGALNSATSVELASDMDEDLVPPIVATFYSLRGGVGRSTALAHTARILASKRHKIVCVDMDLEAPALPVLLGCDDDLRDDQGVVDILMALDHGASPDFASHLLLVQETDNLFVLPAGRISADYARKLQFVNPSAWYREDTNPLRALIDGLRNGLPFRPDVILLDARTGISDLSGPLLFDLADLAIVFFFPHPQGRAGTELLARSVLRTTSGRKVDSGKPIVPDLRFVVSPVPASSAPEVRRRYEQRPLEWIEKWLEEFNSSRTSVGLEALYARDVTHVVPYREDIATSDGVAGVATASLAFEQIADWIESFLSRPEETRTVSSLRNHKAHVLRDLTFSAGTAEEQQGLLEDFVQTNRVDEALSADMPLVLGRKGTGKTSVFRVLSEREGAKAVVVHAPSRLQAGRRWQLSPDGFGAVERALDGSILGWRHFWTLYTSVALSARDGGLSERPTFLSECDLASEEGVISALKRTAVEPSGALELQAWLRRLDAASDQGTLMLLDGLDTGFGSTEPERDRRRKSVEGLFDAWMNVGQSLSNLRFKIMLREDIWRQLNFANKSHLYGQTVNLKWSEQSSFLKVAVKQAMRAEAFREMAVIASLPREDVAQWSDDAVNRAWIQLVGERMKGGQTAYTRNWVWNRLADANSDHSPRHLLQLFREAVDWERSEEAQSPYERSVIRPRALTACLASVSGHAVGALREEFAELEPLLKALQQAGRTPLDAETLEPQSHVITLAREVGLLGVYEESGDQVNRYRVPDLYRLGLAMTRKGQA